MDLGRFDVRIAVVMIVNRHPSTSLTASHRQTFLKPLGGLKRQAAAAPSPESPLAVRSLGSFWLPFGNVDIFICSATKSMTIHFPSHLRLSTTATQHLSILIPQPPSYLHPHHGSYNPPLSLPQWTSVVFSLQGFPPSQRDPNDFLESICHHDRRPPNH